MVCEEGVCKERFSKETETTEMKKADPHDVAEPAFAATTSTTSP